MQNVNDIRTALRAAVINGSKNLVMDAKTTATTALNSIPTSSASAALVTIGVSAAIEMTNAAYASFEAHTQAGKQAYDLFVQDYNTGTVSFFLPDKESDRTDDQRFFAQVLQLFQTGEQGKNSPLFRRAGFHYTEDVSKVTPELLASKTTQGTIYSLISVSALVFAGVYQGARNEDPVLDAARHGSDLFLGANLTKCLDTIHSYQKRIDYDLITGHLSQAAIRRLDLVRITILAFANLLVNLQHPAVLDTQNNFPLSDEDSIELCQEVIEQIDSLLLSAHRDPTKNYLQAQHPKAPFAYFEKIYCKEMLFKFLNLLKQEFKNLKRGYQSKVINQLDLEEVIAQSQEVLQDLNTLWHHMLYLKKSEHPLTPVQSLYLLHGLSDVLNNHPLFWNDLPKIFKAANLKMPVIDGLNQPCRTVIDLIGLIAALPHEQRAILLSKIQASDPEIHAFLKQLDRDFIEPPERYLRTKQGDVAHAFLINLMALTMESYPSFIQESQVSVGIRSLKQQMIDLNSAQISQQDRQPAFTWSILDYFADGSTAAISLNPETIKLSKQLLDAQYQFLDALRNMRALQELLDNNQNLLLHPDVRALLRKTIYTLRDKTTWLAQAGQILNQFIDSDDEISIAEKDDDSNQRRRFIRRALSDRKGLIHRFASVIAECDQAMTLLDSPHFARDLMQNMQAQIETVAYTSHQEFLANKEALLQALQCPAVLVRPSLPSMQHEPMSANSPQPVSEYAPPMHNSFQLQLTLKYMRAISAFLLIAGLLILLSMIYGAPYVPIIAALNAQQFTLGVLVGGTSTLTFAGAAGLGWACFFKQDGAAEAPENGRDIHATVASSSICP